MRHRGWMTAAARHGGLLAALLIGVEAQGQARARIRKTAASPVTCTGAGAPDALCTGSGDVVVRWEIYNAVFPATVYQSGGELFQNASSGKNDYQSIREILAKRLKDYLDGQSVVEPETATVTPEMTEPAQITGDQNDYNPTNLAMAGSLLLASDQLRTITGLQGGSNGRILSLVNKGGQWIQLADQAAASSAGNRFALGGNLLLGPQDAALLQYDGAAQRWLALALDARTFLPDPLTRAVIYEEWLTSSIAGTHEWVATVSGTNASCQLSAVSLDATHKFIGAPVECDTGTTATGRAALNLGSGNNQIVPAQGQLVFGACVRLDILSNATDTYSARLGLHDQTGAGDATDGIYFEYDSTATANWRAAASGGSTRTKVNSAMAVSTTTTCVMGITNAAWTSVDYYARERGTVAWTFIGNIADANIPTATELVWPVLKIEKTVGTAQRNLYVDSYWLIYIVPR